MRYGAHISAFNLIYNIPLIESINNDQLETVKLLLSAGANPTIARQSTASPFTRALEHRNTEIAKVLLEGGAKIHEHDLSIAVGVDIELVEMMIKKGASLDGGEELLSPIFLAVSNANLEATQLLINYGAKVRISYHQFHFTLTLFKMSLFDTNDVLRALSSPSKNEIELVRIGKILFANSADFLSNDEIFIAAENRLFDFQLYYSLVYNNSF